MEILSIKSEWDGLALSASVSMPEGEIRGVVVTVHGMCEHKERYYKFAEYLTSKGYVFIINDLRGHGSSIRDKDDLGYMYRGGWEALVDDIHTMVLFARRRFAGRPVYLLGHSMGAIAACSYIKRYDDTTDGVIISGCPCDNPAKGIGRLLSAAFGVFEGWHCRPMMMQKMTLGSYDKAFKSEGECAWISSDRDIVEEYKADPLCRYVFTANGFCNLLAMMQDCYSPGGWKTANPNMPVLFVSGGDDPCHGKGTKGFFNSVENVRRHGYSNVRSKLYPRMRHEILNEKDRENVWNDVVMFLEGKL